MAKSILFVGSFLSGTRGTINPSEKMAGVLGDHFDCSLVSNKENILFRAFDVFFKVLFTRASIVHIDVFSGSNFYYAALASRVAGLRGKKVILNLHGGKLPEFYRQKKALLTKIFQRADRILSPSLFIIEFFKKEGFDVTYLPNGIDLSHFCYREKPITTPLRLVWVRAYKNIYNPITPILILQELLDRDIDVRLTMVGKKEGLYKATYEKAEALGVVDKVDFKGFVPNQELGEVLSEHDVFLNTPSYESFGIAVVEAITVGLSVVSSKVGELPYLWNAPNNILFAKVEDQRTFADQIEYLREMNDDDLKVRSKVNSEASKKFSLSVVKDDWVKIINHFF